MVKLPTSERLFTISFWFKPCKLGTKQTLLGLAEVSGSTQRPVINYETTGKLTFVTSGGTKINRKQQIELLRIQANGIIF